MNSYIKSNQFTCKCQKLDKRLRFHHTLTLNATECSKLAINSLCDLENSNFETIWRAPNRLCHLLSSTPEPINLGMWHFPLFPGNFINFFSSFLNWKQKSSFIHLDYVPIWLCNTRMWSRIALAILCHLPNKVQCVCLLKFFGPKRVLIPSQRNTLSSCSTICFNLQESTLKYSQRGKFITFSVKYESGKYLLLLVLCIKFSDRNKLFGVRKKLKKKMQTNMLIMI